MKFTLSDGLSLNYEVHGPETAEKTILLLNGLTQSCQSWMGYIPAISAQHRLVLVDLIFQGASDHAPEYRSFEGHAADIAQFIQGIGLEKPTVAGISYGGAVLMRLLVNHPEVVGKGVIMASFAHSTPFFEAIGFSWVRALEVGGYPLMVDALMPWVLSANYFANPLIPVDTLKGHRADNPPTKESLFMLMEATAQSGDYRAELAQVQSPVRVIAGAEDLLCTPEMNQAIAESIPQAEYHVIPEVGHTLNLEAIPQTAAMIMEFA